MIPNLGNLETILTKKPSCNKYLRQQIKHSFKCTNEFTHTHTRTQNQVTRWQKREGNWKPYITTAAGRLIDQVVLEQRAWILKPTEGQKARPWVHVKQGDGIHGPSPSHQHKGWTFKELVFQAKGEPRKNEKHLGGKGRWQRSLFVSAWVWGEDRSTLKKLVPQRIFNNGPALQISIIHVKNPYDKKIETCSKPVLPLWLLAQANINPPLERCSYNPSHKFS